MSHRKVGVFGKEVQTVLKFISKQIRTMAELAGRAGPELNIKFAVPKVRHTCAMKFLVIILFHFCRSNRTHLSQSLKLLIAAD